jgi:hypothetical protein
MVTFIAVTTVLLYDGSLAYKPDAAKSLLHEKFSLILGKIVIKERIAQRTINATVLIQYETRSPVKPHMRTESATKAHIKQYMCASVKDFFV